MKKIFLLMFMLGVTVTSQAERRPNYMEEKPFHFWNWEKDTYGADTTAIWRIFERVNEERAKKGVHPLILDHTLIKCARIRAYEVMEYPEHTRPDGRKFSTVLLDMDYDYDVSGENLCAGFLTADDAMDTWMHSRGHRKNLLWDGYTRIGIGWCPEGECWVQLFAY